MVISRGEGVRVWDEAGKSYIESVAGLWCASLGFSNERLVQAADDADAQAAVLPRFTAKSHEPMIDLAEMLIAARAGADEQGVLRQFRLRGERQRHQDGLVFQQRARPAEEEEADRPRSRAITASPSPRRSLTGLPANHRSFDLPLPGFMHTITPHHYHGAEPGESEERSRPAAPRSWKS